MSRGRRSTSYDTLKVLPKGLGCLGRAVRKSVFGCLDGGSARRAGTSRRVRALAVTVHSPVVREELLAMSLGLDRTGTWRRRKTKDQLRGGFPRRKTPLFRRCDLLDTRSARPGIEVESPSRGFFEGRHRRTAVRRLKGEFARTVNLTDALHGSGSSPARCADDAHARILGALHCRSDRDPVRGDRAGLRQRAPSFLSKAVIAWAGEQRGSSPASGPTRRRPAATVSPRTTPPRSASAASATAH